MTVDQVVVDQPMRLLEKTEMGLRGKVTTAGEVPVAEAIIWVRVAVAVKVL